MPRLTSLLIFLFTISINPPVWGQYFDDILGDNDEIFINDNLLDDIIVDFDQLDLNVDYNAIHLPRYTPQFIIERESEGGVLLLHNGGIGDGYRPTGLDNTAENTYNGGYFCSEDDEEDQYMMLIGEAPPNDNLWGSGRYQVSKITDKWRKDRDGKVLFFARPEVVTDCHRWCGKSVFDIDLWRTLSENPNSSVFGAPGRRDVIRENFERRNFCEDDTGDFRYGRYLFNFLPENNFDASDFAEATDEIHDNVNNPYKRFFIEPNYFDCPFGCQHQQWGFRCAEMARQGAYDDLETCSLPEFPFAPSGVRVDSQMWSFDRTLLKQIVDLMGYRIDQDYWGDIRPALFSDEHWDNETQRQLNGIVVTIYEILNQWVDRMPENASSALSRAANYLRTGKTNLTSFCGDVPEGTLMAAEITDAGVKLIYHPTLCLDVQAKRARSNAHYNVEPHPEQTATSSAFASYGIWSDGGLYDQLFSPNRGYRWIFDESNSQTKAEAVDGKVASNGYGAIRLSLACHQLVHAFYAEQGRVFLPGTPQATSEEELANIAQALCFHHLMQLGQVRNEVGMQTEEHGHQFMPSYVGRSFYYKDEARAYDGIYIGSLYEDMLVIAQNLKNQNPEMARMAANLVSMCAFLPEPETQCINGVCWTNQFVEEEEPPPVVVDIAGDYEGVYEEGAECRSAFPSATLPKYRIAQDDEGFDISLLTFLRGEWRRLGAVVPLSGVYPNLSFGSTMELARDLYFTNALEFEMRRLDPARSIGMPVEFDCVRDFRRMEE